MTPKQVQRRYNQLEKQRQHFVSLLNQLQTECTHPNVQTTHGADTGNYDRSQDSRWVTKYCPDCQWRDTTYT